MRKSALLGLGAAAMMGGGFFIPAFATTPPPTYTTPCGSSFQTGTAPSTPGVQLPSGSSGETGIYGQNGYLDASGSAGPPPSGSISGYGTDGSGNGIYGSVGNSSGSPSVCFGVEQGGAYNTIVNQ